MAIRRIIVLGDPLLRKIVPNVLIANQNLINQIICDLKDTLSFHGKTMAGLAANQIGYPYRMLMIQKNKELFINPVITQKFGKKPSMEGCYSIPGYYAIVPRAKAVNVLYSDTEGRSKFMHTQDEQLA